MHVNYVDKKASVESCAGLLRRVVVEFVSTRSHLRFYWYHW